MDELHLVPSALDWAVLAWSKTGDYPSPERVRVVLHGSVVVAAAADGKHVPASVTGHSSVIDTGPFHRLELQVALEPDPRI